MLAAVAAGSGATCADAALRRPSARVVVRASQSDHQEMNLVRGRLPTDQKMAGAPVREIAVQNRD